MEEDYVLKFLAKPFIMARYYIHTGANGVIILSGNKREQGYILAHKLTHDLEKEVLYYKPGMKALEYLFGKNVNELKIIDDLSRIDENTIVILDSKTCSKKRIINKLPHFILITQSTKYTNLKQPLIIMKINSKEAFLKKIKAIKEGEEVIIQDGFKFSRSG